MKETRALYLFIGLSAIVSSLYLLDARRHRQEPNERKEQRKALVEHGASVDSQLVRSARQGDSSARFQRAIEQRERWMRRHEDSLRAVADSFAAIAADAATARDSAEAWRQAYLASHQEADSARAEANLKDVRIRMLVGDSIRLSLDVLALRSLRSDQAAFQQRLERDLIRAERRPTWKRAVLTTLAVESVLIVASEIGHSRSPR